MAQASKKVSKDLEDLMKVLIDEAKKTNTSLADKLKIADRALKLEIVRAKLDDKEWGSDFDQPEGEE